MNFDVRSGLIENLAAVTRTTAAQQTFSRIWVFVGFSTSCTRFSIRFALILKKVAQNLLKKQSKVAFRNESCSKVARKYKNVHWSDGKIPGGKGGVVQSNPAISKSQGKWKKKFKMAGIWNNRGSVKFVTMNHFLIKYSTVWRKTLIK